MLFSVPTTYVLRGPLIKWIVRKKFLNSVSVERLLEPGDWQNVEPGVALQLQKMVRLQVLLDGFLLPVDLSMRSRMSGNLRLEIDI